MDIFNFLDAIQTHCYAHKPQQHSPQLQACPFAVTINANYAATSRAHMAILLILFSLAAIKCATGGEDSSNRIVGGKPVNPPHKYPWLVQMRVTGYEGEKGLCAGVILDKRWIITTKICFAYDTPQWATLKDIKWVTALHNYRELDPSSQIVTSVEVVNHTGFRRIVQNGAESFQHDIVLVRVSPHIIFTQKVAPVNLPPCDFEIANDTQYVGTAIGWGRNSSLGRNRTARAATAEPKATFTPELHEVQVPILTTRTCQRLLGLFEYAGVNRSMLFTDDHICAGNVEKGGISTCFGDEGGPLMIFNETSKLWTMVGITSSGYGCAIKRLPDTFVKVSKYLRFFTQSTQRCMARKIPVP